MARLRDVLLVVMAMVALASATALKAKLQAKMQTDDEATAAARVPGMRNAAMANEEPVEETFLEGSLKWGYVSGMNGPDVFGPENWYLIDPKYSMCEYSVMGEQSPINLYEKTPRDVTLEDAKSDQRKKFVYRKPKGYLQNNGRTVTLHIMDPEGDPPGGVEWKGNHYRLRKMVFHTPSEHTMGNLLQNGHAAMEMQMVHQLHPPTSGQNMWLIVSILYEEGPDNGFIGGVLKLLKKAELLTKETVVDQQKPSNATEIIGPIDIHSWLDPLGDRYFTYSGSMTTPPCMEDVRWFIMAETHKLSSKQLEEFKQKLGGKELKYGNSRPTMPTNLRSLFYVH